MELKLSEEEKLIQKTAAEFVDRELIAREGAYLRQPAPFLPPGAPAMRELDPDTRRELGERARRAGLWCLDVPESLGGSPMSALARVLIHREFGRSILPFRPVSIPHFLFESQYCERLADGTLALSLAFGEAHKTGDLSCAQALYREEPDGCVVRDMSIFVSNPGADLFLLPAREQGTQRLGIFAIERDTPGVSVSDEIELTTDATVARLTFQQCKIPKEQLVGYEYEAGAIIAAEQLAIAARSLGIGRRCLAACLEQAQNRVTFGRPLADRQAIQWMLADLSIDLRAATWLTLEAAWRCDQEWSYFEEAALAKKRAAKMAFQAADIAIQIHGGYGVCREFPFEGFYREARWMRLLYGREGELDRGAGARFLASP
ncbi:MAG TPA: acyl-CoA dehydrogenase family protein [Candidatus Binatia bacterium]|nr:acyl-CoA dehydrogenase family protein [Candidatus Binatia bacterium]